MTWREFRRHADYAMKVLGVEPQNSPFDIEPSISALLSSSYEVRQGDKALGEGVLHETAHAVTLGLPLPWSAVRIAEALEPLSGNQEDLNEVLAVAAVVAFTREHGLRASPRRLTDFALQESMPHLSPARVHRLVEWLSRRSRTRATVRTMAEALGVGAGASS